LRWRSLFARGRRPPAGPVLNATMVGYLYNNILPARAGEAARIVVLTQRSSTAPAEIVGTVVVERLYDVFVILVIFFAAESWLPHVSWFGAAAVAAIVLALLIAGAAVVLTIYGDRPIRERAHQPGVRDRRRSCAGAGVAIISLVVFAESIETKDRKPLDRPLRDLRSDDESET
jgi:hypothetical protein